MQEPGVWAQFSPAPRSSLQEPSVLLPAQPIHTRSGPGPLRGKSLCFHLRRETGLPSRTGLGAGGLVPKSCPTLVTPWTVARQAALSMGFSRQEYWSGLPCPPPGDLPNPGIKAGSPALLAESLLTELQGKITLYRVSGLVKTDKPYWTSESDKSISQVHQRNWAKETNVDLRPGA